MPHNDLTLLWEGCNCLRLGYTIFLAHSKTTAMATKCINKQRTSLLHLTLYQPMTHICIMSSHKSIRIYMGGLILGVNTLYRLFCFFKLFPMVGKGLSSSSQQHPSHYEEDTSDLFSLGSMVQNGKFSAGAAAFVRTLKKVDFLRKREKVVCIIFLQCRVGQLEM